MVETEPKASAEMENPDAWGPELDRLGELLEQLMTECTRLRAENERLQEALAAVESRPEAAAEIADLKRRLRNERRQWERQRQAIADRIEVILGKFQWMENERNAETSAVGEG